MVIILGITGVVIVLLITAIIVLKRRKGCSSCSPKEALINKAKAPETVKSQPEIKLADKLTVKAEPTAVYPQITDVKIVAPSAKLAAPACVKTSGCSLPQDSILRRHYFTHLCTMIETLAPPRPTDSVLCRHYDTMIAVRIAQCLSDKGAMEQLTCDYGNLNA